MIIPDLSHRSNNDEARSNTHLWFDLIRSKLQNQKPTGYACNLYRRSRSHRYTRSTISFPPSLFTTSISRIHHRPATRDRKKGDRLLTDIALRRCIGAFNRFTLFNRSAGRAKSRRAGIEASNFRASPRAILPLPIPFQTFFTRPDEIFLGKWLERGISEETGGRGFKWIRTAPRLRLPPTNFAFLANPTRFEFQPDPFSIPPLFFPSLLELFVSSVSIQPRRLLSLSLWLEARIRVE